MSADFNPDDGRADVFWHDSLAMWALRARHLPTGTEIVRYAGHGRPRERFAEETWPGALDDLRWLVTHRGPAGSASGRIGIGG
jgi:hypothetical protein